MPLSNQDIAQIFEDVASLLDIEDENPFKIRAYRNAADTIRSLPRPLSEIKDAGETLTDLEGIGKAIAEKIVELLDTGELEYKKKLHETTPEGVIEILRIPGIGVGKVRALRKTIGISSVAELREAAETGKIAGLPGFGAKSEEQILEKIRKYSIRE
jgi:DNA polymerase (family 10)